MLETLSQRDQEWREMAFKICNCRTLSDDLVNDMYLIVMNKERFNEAYIYKTLKGLFLNHLKEKGKTISLENIYYLEAEETDTTQKRFELLEILKDVTWFEREVLLQTHEKSLRKCEEDTGVHYGVFNYHKTKALKKLKDKYGRAKR